MFNIIKTIVILSTTISIWQAQVYKDLSQRLGTAAAPPKISLQVINNNNLNFSGYAVYKDPSNINQHVMHDVYSIPQWLFLIRKNNVVTNELSHRGVHDGVTCNVLNNNKILLHATIAGFIPTNIIFQIKYHVYDTNPGTIAIVSLDKSFHSSDISEFSMVVWVFPHPNVEGLIIIVMQGNVKSPYPIILVQDSIRLHIYSILQNFGNKLVVNNDKM